MVCGSAEREGEGGGVRRTGRIRGVRRKSKIFVKKSQILLIHAKIARTNLGTLLNVRHSKGEIFIKFLLSLSGNSTFFLI